MLVLSRKRDESITIQDNIVITVIEIRGDKVRLGIECPHQLPVHRTEVWKAIQRHNQQETTDGKESSDGQTEATKTEA